MSELIRLNKLLAEQLGTSRREADQYIEKGRVKVNGIIAKLGARITREVDRVSIDDNPLTTTQTERVYIMLNKPTGYVCSRREQGNIPTIYSLLPPEYHALKPVGRLDKDSSGLLLLTNDGDFAHHMTHPLFQKTKIYYTTLDQTLAPLHQQMINDHGIQLEDGNSRLSVTTLTDTPEQEIYPEATYRAEMHEGRNRQIRRTFAALGYTVIKLHRTQFGQFRLGLLSLGKHASVNVL